ncbi:hypothetical protein QOZ80_7BG0590310 [Eleusine coracana subsp. coracana]|nr:hypothetical protein QOZ80_7BG0590310 [Eleusine coracana subsp. coracana]
MEVDVSRDESAESLTPGRGKKRPASPEKHSSDGDDSSMSDTIDDDWKFSNWDSKEEEENEHDEEDMDANQGTCRPFTVDEFPRLSSDHFVQTDTIYARKDLHRRGPSPLSLFRPFNDPVITRKSNHWFGQGQQCWDL